MNRADYNENGVIYQHSNQNQRVLWTELINIGTLSFSFKEWHITRSQYRFSRPAPSISCPWKKSFDVIDYNATSFNSSIHVVGLFWSRSKCKLFVLY